jgi:MFS family permease
MDKSRLPIVLLATSVSYVLVILDTSILNVALQNISISLETDVTGLQWIVAAYVVVFASLVLSGGALGDIFWSTQDLPGWTCALHFGVPYQWLRALLVCTRRWPNPARDRRCVARA